MADQQAQPVQRLMTAISAKNSWANMPAGQKLNEMYRSVIDVITKAVATVKANPPAFSRLARLYGMNFVMDPPPDAMASANILMPIVHGYNDAVRTCETTGREGFRNVKRDNMTVLWTNMWKNYIEDVASGKLTEFINGANLPE